MFKINEYSLNLFKLYVNVKTTPRPPPRTCLVTLITFANPPHLTERRTKKKSVVLANKKHNLLIKLRASVALMRSALSP